MSAQIVSLEDIEAARRVAEEPIEPDTFIPIIDADPEKMAIVLRPKTWKKRRDFLENRPQYRARLKEEIARIDAAEADTTAVTRG